ncbi:MAG TPA: glycine betaine ABC transporter substrate-binding protein, partial [Nitrospiria bacterium]|nr:glycine betaine ABC transporter substrate-binding protein [Nitrospiria bacterium]
MGADTQPAPLVLTRINETFYQATAALVVEVLTRTGQPVTVVDGSHTSAYKAIQDGTADLCVGFWLPTGHEKAWNQVKDSAVELSTIYEGARFYWAVPSYIPESEVSSIEDLRKPSVNAKMIKTIRGLSLDASITTESIDAIGAYDLGKAGYRVIPGGFEPWKEALGSAIETKAWIVEPLWEPYYFNRIYSLRPLKDPKNVFKGRNRVILAAHNGVREKLPKKTIDALKRMRVRLEDITDMDVDINVNSVTPEVAAR